MIVLVSPSPKKDRHGRRSRSASVQSGIESDLAIVAGHLDPNFALTRNVFVTSFLDFSGQVVIVSYSKMLFFAFIQLVLKVFYKSNSFVKLTNNPLRKIYKLILSNDVCVHRTFILCIHVYMH